MEKINKGYQQQETPNQAYGMVMQPTLLSVPPPPLPPPPLVLPPSPFVLSPSSVNLINVDQAKKHVEVTETSDRIQNRHGDMPSIMPRPSNGINDYATYLNNSYKYEMPHVNSDILMHTYKQYDPKIEMVNFGNTPGYYKYGCWYNSKYNQIPLVLPTQAPTQTTPTRMLLTTAPPLPPMPPPLPPPPPPPPQSPPPTPPPPPPQSPQASIKSPLAMIQPIENVEPMSTPFIQPPQTGSEPQMVEVNILPGIQLRRTASKLIIDIDFANPKSNNEINQDNSMEFSEPNNFNSIKIDKDKIIKLTNRNTDKSLNREQHEQMTQTSSSFPINFESPFLKKMENVLGSMEEMKIEPTMQTPVKAFRRQMGSEQLSSRNQMEIQMNPQYSQSTFPIYPMQMPIGLCPTKSTIPIIYQHPESSKFKENIMDIKRGEQCFIQIESTPTSLSTPYPNMPIKPIQVVNNNPSKSIIQIPPIVVKKDQGLVHHVQVEMKPSLSTPYPNMSKPIKPIQLVNSNPPIPTVHIPPIEDKRDQRLVHHVQVEKRPSSPTPYLHGHLQDITATQTDYHHQEQHHKIHQTDENVSPATLTLKSLPREGTFLQKSDAPPNDSSTSMERMPSTSPCVAVANIAYWPLLGTRAPNKCKSLRKQKINQLQKIPQESTPTLLPKQKKNVKQQTINCKTVNINERSQSKEKPNVQKQMVKENLVQGKKPLTVKMVEEKKNLQNTIPNKNNKSLVVGSPKKIKIKLDRSNTSKAMPLTTYTSNMFDILGTIDTNSNTEEIEGTESEGIVNSEKDLQESIMNNRKELKKLKKKKLKLLKLQKQKQLEDKLAKNIEKKKEKRRREKLQADIIMLRKIALGRLEAERQKRETDMDTNPQHIQSPPIWCRQNYKTPTVIFRSNVQKDNESSTTTSAPERLGLKRSLQFEDSNSSSSDGDIRSYIKSSDSLPLSKTKNNCDEFQNNLSEVCQDISDIPLPTNPRGCNKNGHFVEGKKQHAKQQHIFKSHEQERDTNGYD